MPSDIHSLYLSRYDDILDNIYDYIDILPIKRSVPAYKIRLKDNPDFVIETTSIKKKELIHSLKSCNEFNMWISYTCSVSNGFNRDH